MNSIAKKFWRFLTNKLRLENGAKECKGVHCVDLGESFPTRIYLQKSASIQPKTSNILPKFCQKLATTLRVRRAGFGRTVDGAAAVRLVQQLSELLEATISENSNDLASKCSD